MERLESKRLVLKEIEPSDFKDFWDLSINWKAAPGPEFDKFPVAEKECRAFFEECLKNSGGTRYIYLRDEKKMIGLISFNGLDENGRMDMGHIIHSDYQNDDIDREALKMSIDHFFKTTEAKTIITHNFPDEKQEAPLYSLGFADGNREHGELLMDKENWLKRRKSWMD